MGGALKGSGCHGEQWPLPLVQQAVSASSVLSAASVSLGLKRVCAQRPFQNRWTSGAARSPQTASGCHGNSQPMTWFCTGSSGRPRTEGTPRTWVSFFSQTLWRDLLRKVSLCLLCCRFCSTGTSTPTSSEASGPVPTTRFSSLPPTVTRWRATKWSCWSPQVDAPWTGLLWPFIKQLIDGSGSFLVTFTTTVATTTTSTEGKELLRHHL